MPFTISFPGLSVPFVTESRDTKTADSDADASSEAHTISGVDEVGSSDIVAESMTSGSMLLYIRRYIVHGINTLICLMIKVSSVQGPIMQ